MHAETSAGRPPGFLWILLLGGIGFAAGFFGPMVFNPDSNLGPIVGLLFSGPAGLVVGLVFYVLFRVVPAPPRVQWSLLAIIGSVGGIVTLLCVQPEPATRGYLLEVEVRGQRPVAAAADEMIAAWKKRIAAAPWATPRAGWEAEMRATIAKERGTVLDTAIVRERIIRVNRKPWNRGQLFATEGFNVAATRSYYFPDGQLPADAKLGAHLRLFVAADSTQPIRAPSAWPPTAFAEFAEFSTPVPVPAEYDGL